MENRHCISATLLVNLLMTINRCYGNADCSVAICDVEPWMEWTECPCGLGEQTRKRALCCDLTGDDLTLENCLPYCGLVSTNVSETRSCRSSYCENVGTLQADGHSCECTEGYEGHCCQNETDECASNPCLNGATCYDWLAAYSCDCPTGFYGTQCETGVCQPSVADIVFVLDSSVSQTEDNFKRQLEFVKGFIDHVTIGENDQQVAIVTYSTVAQIQITLGQYQNKSELQQAVGNITFMPGATFTDRGLEAAAEAFEESSPTRVYGNTAKRYVVVLTDGMSYDRAKTEAAAIELKAMVNKVLTVGIGLEVSHSELLAIASNDDQGGSKYVFSVKNFNALYTIVKQLVHITCEECLRITSSNVVLLLDTSSTMSNEDIQISLDAMTYLIEKIVDLETDNSTVRIAVLAYSFNVHVYNRLDDLLTKQELILQVQTIGSREQFCSSEDGENCLRYDLGSALKYVREEVFIQASQKVNNSKDILLILSNGKTIFDEDVVTEVTTMRNEDKTMLAVAVGTSSNSSNLQLLTDDSALLFLVEKDELTSLDALVGEIFFSACNLTGENIETD